MTVRHVARTLPAAAWRSITWRNGTQPRRRARFAAVRVTPAHGLAAAPAAPEVWLLCEQETGPRGRLKYYFVHLPATATWRGLVTLAHQRWAIEQQYQELKSELGLDHFEGRTYPGWQHHVVLTAVAHAYIQRERMRRGAATLTFPAVRAIVQEIFTALLFAAKPTLHALDGAGETRASTTDLTKSNLRTAHDLLRTLNSFRYTPCCVVMQWTRLPAGVSLGA